LGIALVRNRSNNPTQLTGGPGNTGRKLPRMPTSIKIKPRIRNRISIEQIDLWFDEDTWDLLQFGSKKV
jgi:hypothetical protein